MRNRQPKRSANTIRAVFELVPFQIFHIKTMQNSDNSNEKPIQNPYAVEKEYGVKEQADEGPANNSLSCLHTFAWIVLIIISMVAGAGAFLFTCIGGAEFANYSSGGINLVFILSSAAGILTMIALAHYGGKLISKF